MIYLDNAATTFPKPKKVYDEVINCMRNYAANPGRGSYNMAVKAEDKIMECREEIAKFFNIISPMNIVFTSNATESLNIAIKGVLKPCDHVITTFIEHNSVLRPINTMREKGVEVTVLKVNKKGYLNLEDIEKGIKKNTKAIVINHASNVLGTVQDIESIGKITKEKGIIFIVDASQSGGIIPIDAKKCNIDLLALPGHKGLMGPEGTGVLCINNNSIDLDVYTEGGTGSQSNMFIQPSFLPDRFESGTRNVPGIAGLCEGIKFIKNIGIENLKKHENSLCKFLIDELLNIDSVELYGDNNVLNRASVVSFNIKGSDSSEIGYILNKKDVCVRTGYHCAPLIHKIIGTENRGTIRASLGYFNTFDDIKILIKNIKELEK